MSKTQSITYESVNAFPVKSFFVNMLTRDIKLEDAILDLLDNCVDGILRSKSTVAGKMPYKGHYAEIKFGKDHFSISDNCGGIPWDLKDYAFRMGRTTERPKDIKGTVGVYGIGMKRAIFKIGEHCSISTQSGEARYEVEIKPDWLKKESDWMIPVQPAKGKRDPEDGTTIVIGKLHEGIASRFGEDAKSFQAELEKMVATHYAFILDKGFQVKINDIEVKPRPTKLVYAENTSLPAIKPYIFETTIDGVEIFLTVGFTRPIPSEEEASDAQEEARYSSEDAGWTIVCNDRAVLFCDRTELTGWGEAGIPRYHTQFIAISGIVEFKAKDPSKLPTTTTKRGIESSSRLYLQVKNKMREGMSLFIDYTNQWKGRADESKKHIDSGARLSLDEIKSEAKNLTLNSTKKTILQGKQYKPALPLPKKLEARKRRITYLKDIDEVERLAEYLFEDKDAKPSDVGEKCFSLMLKEAKK